MSFFFQEFKKYFISFVVKLKIIEQYSSIVLVKLILLKKSRETSIKIFFYEIYSFNLTNLIVYIQMSLAEFTTKEKH